MEEILYKLFTNTPAFRGEEHYWRRGTANDTIVFRDETNKRIQAEGFTLEIQQQILRWGGIHGFKQFDFVDESINDIVDNDLITLQTANAISSYSKLFAFYNPNQYFILDARVSYVFNKLIIENEIANYLPINFNIRRSRNNRLINNYREIMNTWMGGLVNIQDVYPSYCEFIIRVYNHFIEKDENIFTDRGFDKNCPEIIEMFLFYMADHM